MRLVHPKSETPPPERMDEKMTGPMKLEKVTDEEVKKLKPEEIGTTGEVKESDVEGQNRYAQCPWCQKYVRVLGNQRYVRCYHCGFSSKMWVVPSADSAGL
jgi:hypothetical protein